MAPTRDGQCKLISRTPVHLGDFKFKTVQVHWPGQPGYMVLFVCTCTVLQMLILSYDLLKTDNLYLDILLA